MVGNKKILIKKECAKTPFIKNIELILIFEMINILVNKKE